MFLLLLFLFSPCFAYNIADDPVIVMKFHDPHEDPLQVAKQLHMEYLGPVSRFLPEYHRFSAKTEHFSRSTVLARAADKASWIEEQIGVQQHTRYAAPSDPLYSSQWHLGHINAKDVWDMGITGKDVNVAIVDDGLLHSHPDLQANYCPQYSHDFNQGDADPSPGIRDFHGTSCAGVVASVANNTHCGTGVAPGAGLVGERLIGGPSTDLQEALALSHQSDVVDIYSCSWGPRDDGRQLAGPGRLVRETLVQAAKHGRQGKGSIFVWASGNGYHVGGDSCAYDGYASSPYTIAIGAVDHTGKKAYYSEACSALMAVAPSSGSKKGITTVDVSTRGLGYNPNGECTADFGGTSSACPLAAGSIALVLEANPALTWRDVQLLIAKSSKVVDGTHGGWSTNSRRYRHNQWYGFGMIDAHAMVKLAKTWKNVPKQMGFSSGRILVNLAIPGDGKPACVSHKFSGSQINFVEHVLLRMKIRHRFRGQLRIRLKSPEDVVSILADQHVDANPNYPFSWLFTSVRHFGERVVNGDWHICVEDVITDNYSNGMFELFELVVYGHNEEGSR